MFARTTTIDASPSSVDEGIAYLRDDVMPALLRMPGCVGFSLLVDRGSGRCIATSSWDTEQAMRASERAVEAVRDEGTKAFDGTVVDVQQWEIGLLHRERHTRAGTCARVTWLKADPSSVERGLDLIRTVVLPTAQQQPGFCSMSALVDASAGRVATAAAYDTRADMERSRDTARTLRTRTASDLGAQVEAVNEFELAIAHLRVPELV